MAWLQNLVAPVFCSNRMSSLRQRDTYAFNERICLTFLFPRPTLGSDTCTMRKEQLPKRRGRLCFSSRFRSSCPSSYLPIFPWQWKFIELAGYLKKYPTCSLPMCCGQQGLLKGPLVNPVWRDCFLQTYFMFLILVYLLLFLISSLKSWTAQKYQAGISNLDYSVLAEKFTKA